MGMFLPFPVTVRRNWNGDTAEWFANNPEWKPMVLKDAMATLKRAIKGGGDDIQIMYVDETSEDDSPQNGQPGMPPGHQAGASQPPLSEVANAIVG